MKEFHEIYGANSFHSTEAVELLEEMERLEADEAGSVNPDEYNWLRGLCLLGQESVWGWEDGVDLIHDDCFKEHAIELGGELCFNSIDEWPLSYIDWDRAAESLLQGYTQILYGDPEFEACVYWVRS